MKKNYKRIFAFGVILIVFSIIITGCKSKNNLAESEKTNAELLLESQAEVSALKGETAELKRINEELLSQNDNLDKQNKELQKKLTQALSEKSDITTQDQVMTDLMYIYKLYKSGKATDALVKIKKIEPMGFDDITLAFYEMLKDVLE